MSLAERLSQSAAVGAGLPCKIGSLLTGSQLSKEDKAKLAEVLEVPYGLDVGDTAVTKHRRGACRCFGSNPKISA